MKIIVSDLNKYGDIEGNRGNAMESFTILLESKWRDTMLNCVHLQPLV